MTARAFPAGWLEGLPGLVDRMVSAGMEAVEVECGAQRLRIALGAEAARPDRATAAVTPRASIPSPFPGVLRTSHPSGCWVAPLPGRTVRAGEIVGLLEAGDLLLPVVAAEAGTLAAQVPKNGALVGVGDPVFALVRP